MFYIIWLSGIAAWVAFSLAAFRGARGLGFLWYLLSFLASGIVGVAIWIFCVALHLRFI